MTGRTSARIPTRRGAWGLAVCLAVGAAGLAAGNEPVPAPPEETPAYGRAAPSLYHFWHSPNWPLELTGVNLFDEETALTSTHPAIQEGRELSAEVFVRRTGVLPAEPVLQLHIQGSGPAYTREIPVPATDMALGGVYKVSIAHRLPRFRYSGESVLAIRGVEDEENEPVTLFTLPLTIEPDILESDAGEARIEEAFGAAARRFNQRVRLGLEAEARFPVPPEYQDTPWAALGLVSRLEFSPHYERGERVATLRLYRDGAEVAEAPLIANAHTAFGNRDYYPDMAARPPGVPVFDSWEAGRLSQAGEPFDLYLFAGTLTFPEPVAFDEIAIAYEADVGLLEIADLVLLPEDHDGGEGP